MPAYNCEKYIEKAIDSILNQSHTHFELLIADDCSTDNTKKLIDHYKNQDTRIITYHNEKNQGYHNTCNKLLALSSGDFITFQDADDWSTPERLSLQLAAFSNDDELMLCGTCGVIVDEKGDYMRDSIRETDPVQLAINLQLSNQFIGASIMIKKSVYQEFGGYSDFFNQIGWEDYDWAFRISEKYKCINLPEKTYYYRQHANSISKNISLRKHICKDIVVFLGEQRRKNGGKDSLNSTELETELETFIQEKEAPYLEDPSLLFREKAAVFMYSKLYKEAIKSSVLAIKKAPTKIVNYRTLFYCLRKSILS